MNRRDGTFVVLLAVSTSALACGGDGVGGTGNVDTDDSTAGPQDSVQVSDEEQRPASTALYLEDPLRYWARFGLPVLARHAAAVEPDVAATDVFSGVLIGFDEGSFLTAIESGALTGELETRAMSLLAENPASEVWITLVRDVVTVLDELRLGGGTDAELAAQYELLYLLVELAIDLDRLAKIAPSPDKDAGVGVVDVPAGVCTPGTDIFSEQAATKGPAQDSQQAVKWRDIMIPKELWDSEHDAACMAVAAGVCASKLGLEGFGPTTTCEQYDAISKELGATPGSSGGTPGGLIGFFTSRGYCFHVAYEGALESTCEEGQKALGRGCDVFVTYYNASGGAHIENVDKITLNANDSSRCKIDTLSWGQSESVDFEGGELVSPDGKFSGKSDGTRYRSAPDTPSYLEGTGRALIVYFCPC